MPAIQKSTQISLVIPLFNEEEVFSQLILRLKAAMDGFGLTAEVILVDDGSHDQTPALIAQTCVEDTRFRGVALSRNFGHQIAVTAGLKYAFGDTVAVLDGDLQDPPEVLLEFYRKLQEGYDVVYAIRQKRKENILKRTAYAAFYRILRQLATIHIPLDSGDFCIMSRRVVRLINSMPERHRYIRGLRSWVGFRQVGIGYDRSARAGGEPKYTISKLIGLATDGIFTFSEKPLTWSTKFGAAIACLAFAWGFYLVIWRLFITKQAVQGFTTISAGIFFLGGVQLISIGILGEYIGRIHNEVKQRPLFVVERLSGFARESEVGAACATNAEDPLA